MSPESAPERGRGTTGLWLALLILGQCAAVALVGSGKGITWQHYRFERFLHWRGALAAAVLAVQAVVVVWGWRGTWSTARTWLRARFGPVALALAVITLVAVAAAPSRDISRYAAELLFGAAIQLVALMNVVALARVADGGWLAAVLGPSDRRETGRFLERPAVAAAVFAALVCAVLAVTVWEHIPHLPDEVVYLLHARYFAAGRFQLALPPVPAGFDVDLMYYDAQRWFSPVPPGWPAILSLGVRAGVPWLVNPLLSGVAVLLLHGLARRLMPVRQARVATFLLATSPWFLFLGMSFMTHTASLTCAIAAALGVAVARERKAAWPAALAGVAAGAVSLIRPLEGLIVAVTLGLWSLSARSRWHRLLPSAALTAFTALTALLVLPYNARLTGSPSRFPIMMYVDKYYHPGANDLGFGPNRGMGWPGLDPFPGHGLRDVVVNSLLNGSALNLELFAWATGSLVLLVAVVCSRRLRALDFSMLGVIVLVTGLHALYWFSGGPDFGARYWFLLIVPAVVLTARAPDALFGDDTPGSRRALLAMAALTAAALTVWVPWRAVEKYDGYRYMGGEMRAFVHEHPLGRSLVLVRGLRSPDYHEAALANPLDLRADTTIFAWDRSPAIRAAVVAAYPDRPVYILDGPTLTGSGYRIIAGPLPPGSTAPDIVSSEQIPKLTGDEEGPRVRSP